MFTVLVCLSLSVDPAEVTVEEANATFLANAARAATLRVYWTRTTQDTAARKNYFKIVGQRQVELTKNGGDAKAGDPKAAADRAATMLDSAAEPSADSVRTWQLDYWTDRENFQFRVPLSPQGRLVQVGTAAKRLSVPGLEVTVDNLVTEFDRVLVSSHGPATNHQFRTWGAQPLGKSHHSGGISIHPILAFTFFPPLALPPGEWIEERHPIDDFFHGMKSLPTRTKVLGLCAIGGADTLVVEKFWEDGWRPFRASNATTPKLMRAFVDLSRGGIPLRVEYFGEFPSSDAPRPSPISDLAFLVRDVVIEDVGSGVWYPVSGVIDVTGAGVGVGTTSAGIPREIHQVVTWRTSTVEPNRPMSRDNFALRFPPSTVISDASQGELLVTGDRDGTAERVVQVAVAIRHERRFPWGWWLAAAGVVSGLVFGSLAVRRWTRG